ncbi:MAG: polysaccharide deacetylase family protein [Aerococcus sp.]|nr:polysaccharide deacetylase family protein [Aerococcus sp.]
MFERLNFTVQHALLAILALLILATGFSLGIDIGQNEESRTTASARPSKMKKTSDLAQLKSSTNHNQQATNHAYTAKDVLQQMQGKDKTIKERVVFLTFDDGPDSKNTPQILDILKKEDVPATFFEIGRFVNDKTAPILKRQIKEGHAIGIHSYSHDYQRLYPNGQADPMQLTKEYQESLHAMQQVLGPDFKSQVFRYPGGRMSWGNISATDEALKQQNIYAIDWNAAVGDALSPDQQPKTVQEMLDFNARSLNFFPDYGVRVVLMHDSSGHGLTTESLAGVIQFYKDHHFKFGILE